MVRSLRLVKQQGAFDIMNAKQKITPLKSRFVLQESSDFLAAWFTCKETGSENRDEESYCFE